MPVLQWGILFFPSRLYTLKIYHVRASMLTLRGTFPETAVHSTQVTLGQFVLCVSVWPHGEIDILQRSIFIHCSHQFSLLLVNLRGIFHTAFSLLPHCIKSPYNYTVFLISLTNVLATDAQLMNLMNCFLHGSRQSLGGFQGLPRGFVDDDEQVSHLVALNYRVARSSQILHLSEKSRVWTYCFRKFSSQTQTLRPCSDPELRTYLKSVHSDHISAVWISPEPLCKLDTQLSFSMK